MINILVKTIIDINTERRHSMLFRDLLERLAEMFPKQDYQSRLDRFINSHNPKSASDVEHYAKVFEKNEIGRLGL